MSRAWNILSGPFMLVVAVLKNLYFNDCRTLVEKEGEAATGRAMCIEGVDSTLKDLFGGKK